MTPSLHLTGFLEQCTELRETVYLLDYQFIINTSLLYVYYNVYYYVYYMYTYVYIYITYVITYTYM